MEVLMKFMAIWTGSPDTRDDALARFKETGGAPPPGVKMLGRWHDISGSSGFALAESDDPKAIHRWVLSWSDLLSFELVAVIDDQEFAQSIG